MEASSRSKITRDSERNHLIKIILKDWKRSFNGLLVALHLGLLALILSPAPLLAGDQPTPKLLIESAVYNFGTARQGTKVSTSFKLKNGGNAELILQRVVAACGCTTTNPGKDKLAPGESTDVKVVFDTSGFTGEKLKTVRVFSNDPDQPSALLTIQGVVEPDVTVEPARLMFPEIMRGEATQGASQEFTVSVRPGASVRLGTPFTSASTISITQLSSSETTQRIRVTLNPDFPPGELRERVIIPLTNGSSSMINVPVIATIKGTLELRPIALSFGVIEGTEPIQKMAKLVNLGTSPVAIESISSDNEAVSAVSRPAGKSDGKRSGATGHDEIHEIIVTLNPAKIATDLRATITIKTSSKSEPALVLGVYGIRPVIQ